MNKLTKFIFLSMTCLLLLAFGSCQDYKTYAQQLEEMDGQTILEKYSQEKDGMEKTELAAMMLLKMAEDTENLVPKARLRQEGLYLLKYVQEHGNTYSLPRNLLIQFLESKN